MTRPILLVEDEPLLRQQLRETLATLWPERTAIIEAGFGAEALQLLETMQPEIAFLDINLPDISGIELARQMRGRCQVVFVTAYDQHAIAAFEQEAVDYVLKPATVRRLTDTVARLKARQPVGTAPDLDRLLARLDARLGRNESHLRWIQATSGHTTELVAVEDVQYFLADDKYTEVVTSGATYLIRKSIRELTDALDPQHFWQIHRATIVNVAAIARIVREPGGGLKVCLKAGEKVLPVSRAFAHRFRA